MPRGGRSRPASAHDSRLYAAGIGCHSLRSMEARRPFLNVKVKIALDGPPSPHGPFSTSSSTLTVCVVEMTIQSLRSTVTFFPQSPAQRIA
jgi:hypothetical protein